MIRLSATAVATALILLPASAPATIFTDGLNVEAPERSIQELRDIQRQLNEPTDRRQHEVRIAVAAITGTAAMAFAAFLLLRRR
jgi:hypothetical protein